MGWTDATNTPERDYTGLVTIWSTLISSLVLLPITVARLKMRPNQGLYNHLELVDMLGGFPRWVLLLIFYSIFSYQFLDLK